MKFQLAGEEAALKQGLQLLLEAKGHQLAEGGISIVPAPHPEKTLTVSRTGDRVEIGYCQTVHFFRGMSLVLQHPEDSTYS